MITRTMLLAVFSLAISLVALAQDPPPSPAIGIDPNYALDMSKHDKTWQSTPPSAPLTDPLPLFANAGCNSARIRLWVGDTEMNQLNYATETALRAQKSGLKPYLVIFLSDNWADLVKQPAPTIWKDLPQDKKLAAIQAYSESVVRHMAGHGVKIDTFAIGNEIDFGICGQFEEQWPHRVSLDFMRTKIWPHMLPIIKSAQTGVLAANPKAKFIVHLAQWNNLEYCLAFWQFMLDHDIQLDTPALSYYPSSADKPEQRQFPYLQTQAAKITAALHKPVLICETAYPCSPNFPGQFASWNHPAENYPLSETGQALWLTDLVALVRTDPNFAGLTYWSPEWYGPGLWQPFALFDNQGHSRPALDSFKPNTPASQPGK